MNVSVVVCTWNNARRLAITLESLAEMAVEDRVGWQVIVVANNCTDQTEAVAGQWANRLPLRLVHEPRQGLSHARNTGLAAAEGELVVFADDDVKVPGTWVTDYWRAFESRPQGYYFGGPVDSEYEGAQLDPALLAYAPFSVKGLDHGDEARELRDDERMLAANWACRRQAILDAGGFDPEAGLNPSRRGVRVGEETQLMAALRERGMRGWYLPSTRIRHLVPPEKCTLRHIAERYEASIMRYAEANPQPLTVWRKRFIPVPVAARVFGRWLQWRLAVLRGRKGYIERIKLAELVGCWRGWRTAKARFSQS